MPGSVTEMRFKRSVVLMSSDLPTMTRRGADPVDCWDCGGRVVVWVPVGALEGLCGGSAVAGCCCRMSPCEGSASNNTNSVAPKSGVRTLIFRFFSLGADPECVGGQPTESSITWSQDFLREI